MKNLTDTQLLAMFLRKSPKFESPEAHAAYLLDQAGSLAGVIRGDAPSLPSITKTQLEVGVEIARRLKAELPQGKIGHPDDALDFITREIADEPHEVFAALFLDAKHQVISFEVLFRGTIDHTAVHPREVLRRALTHNAAAMIVAHNHPSGDVTPSEADKTLTYRLKAALDLVDIRLLDHFVIGQKKHTSLAAKGVL